MFVVSVSSRDLGEEGGSGGGVWWVWCHSLCPRERTPQVGLCQMKGRSALGSSRLADCRAYEMVSPPYKEGYGIFVQSFSSDGEQAIVKSLGDLAGDQGEIESFGEAGLYLDRRTATGWQSFADERAAFGVCGARAGGRGSQ